MRIPVAVIVHFCMQNILMFCLKGKSEHIRVLRDMFSFKFEPIMIMQTLFLLLLPIIINRGGK